MQCRSRARTAPARCRGEGAGTGTGAGTAPPTENVRRGVGAALPPQPRGWAAPLVPGRDTGCTRGHPVRRWHGGDWDLEVRGHPQDHSAPQLVLPAPYTAPLPAFPLPGHPCRAQAAPLALPHPALPMQEPDQSSVPSLGGPGLAPLSHGCGVLTWRGSSHRVSTAWLPPGPSGPQLCQSPVSTTREQLMMLIRLPGSKATPAARVGAACSPPATGSSSLAKCLCCISAPMAPPFPPTPAGTQRGVWVCASPAGSATYGGDTDTHTHGRTWQSRTDTA